MSRAQKFVEKANKTVEIELPSGCPALLRRPPLLAWAMAGTLPPFFAPDVRAAWSRIQEIDAAETGDAMDDADALDTLKVVRGLAVWAFVDPKLKDGATGEDNAIDPSFLSEEDWNFLTAWLMTGSAGVPVETKAGEMTVGAVRNFRDGEEGREPVPRGKARRAIPQNAKRAPRSQR